MHPFLSNFTIEVEIKAPTSANLPPARWHARPRVEVPPRRSKDASVGLGFRVFVGFCYLAGCACACRDSQSSAQAS